MTQDKISLTLEPRTVEGKAVKHLRKQGIVPAVIHDHGKDSVLVQGEYQTVNKAYLQAGKHHPIALKAGGKNYTAMIKTIDFEPKKHTITHVVFGAVKANEKVEAEVPIHPRYAEGEESSPAERASLIVIANLSTVNVEATATNMPDALYYDAEKLVEAGDHVTVADLEVPEHVEIKAEPEAAVATVYEPSALAAANDAAGGDAEPGDEQAVDSDVIPENVDESAGQEDEIRPGGKEEFEDKSQGHNPEKQ
jgi:large subunit ribosomal protein L25